MVVEAQTKLNVFYLVKPNIDPDEAFIAVARETEDGLVKLTGLFQRSARWLTDWRSLLEGEDGVANYKPMTIGDRQGREEIRDFLTWKKQTQAERTARQEARDRNLRKQLEEQT